MHCHALNTYPGESRREKTLLFDIYDRNPIACSDVQPTVGSYKQVSDTFVTRKIGKVSNLNERPHLAIFPQVNHIIFVNDHQHIAAGNIANHPYGRPAQAINLTDAPNRQLLLIDGQ